jgi:dipeptidyl aminopeptidase/acylaminoacyl peptidase
MTSRWPLAAALLVAAPLAFAQAVAPPASLAADGVPPIPARLARDVRPYGEFTTHVLLSWHPQSREILVRRGATGEVHRVAAPGATPEPLAASGGTVAQAEYQPVTGDYLVFTRATAADDVFRLYRQRANQAPVAVSAAGERVASFAWSPRGDRLVYATHDDAGTTLHVVDPLHPGAARVLARFDGGGWGEFHFSRDGRRLAFTRRISAAESQVWVLDTQTGTRGRVTPASSGKPVSYASPRFARDARALFVLSDRDSEYRHLAYLPLGPGRERTLTAAHAHDVDEFEIGWDKNRIAFTTNEDGTDVLRFLDAGTFEELPRPPLFDAVIGALRWRPGSDEIAFQVSSARTAGDVFSYQLGENRLARWTNGNNPEVNTRELAEPQLVRWKSFDGREITALLYAPPERFTGPRPVVVMLHGGPARQARPAFIGRHNYLVNELGVALVYPNVRWSAGFGKSFLALDDGRHREDAVRDVGALLEWIASTPQLDAKRVVVSGTSHGGDLAFAAGARYPDRVAGILAAHGLDDSRVPPARSRERVHALRRQGMPTAYITARDEGHGFSKEASAEYLVLATVEFVKRVLALEP